MEFETSPGHLLFYRKLSRRAPRRGTQETAQEVTPEAALGGVRGDAQKRAQSKGMHIKIVEEMYRRISTQMLRGMPRES